MERDPDLERAKQRAAHYRKAANRTPEQAQRERERAAERHLRRRDRADYQDRKAEWESRRPRRVVDTTDPTYRERLALRSQETRDRMRAQQKATKEAATGYRFWTPEEDAQVIRTDITVVEIALNLRRTRAAVTTRRRDLKRRGARP